MQNDLFVSARAILSALASTHAVTSAAEPSCTMILKNIAQPERGIRAISIANRQGIIVCSSIPVALGVDISDRPHFVQNTLAHRQGILTAEAPDGIRRIFAFVGLPGTSAHVAVGFDESEVLSSASSAMWLALAELGAVSLLVLLSIWFDAERLLVRPIRVLIEAAGRIGRGEDKTRASDRPWAAEFIPLAAALDEMTDKLDAREQELRDINMQLRELAQIDSLTGLANRRTFNAQLLTEWKLALKRQ